MRAIGVVGYKNSGKTTLTRALIRELAGRGHRVAAVKHTTEQMDLGDKDTARLGEFAEQVGFVSPTQSGVFIKGEVCLDEILVHLDADLVVIEGFKQEQTYPKIACLSGRSEDQNLFSGLIICAVGPGDRAPELSNPDVPYLNRDAIEQIADLAEKTAFKLPNLNCGGCGYEDCYGLACQIVAGAKHTVGLRADGTVVAVGDNTAGQCNVGGWTGVSQNVAGGKHTVGLNSDGTIVAIGDNGYGQCNVGGWMLG